MCNLMRTSACQGTARANAHEGFVVGRWAQGDEVALRRPWAELHNALSAAHSLAWWDAGREQLGGVNGDHMLGTQSVSDLMRKSSQLQSLPWPSCKSISSLRICLHPHTRAVCPCHFPSLPSCKSSQPHSLCPLSFEEQAAPQSVSTLM